MTTPSWQPDPFHRHEYRWWDSQQWTEHVSDHGVAAVDPIMAPPVAPHPTWAAPHLDPPTANVVRSSPTPKPDRKGVLVGTAIVVAAAVGVGGYLLLRGDASSPAAAATTVVTTIPVTAIPVTTGEPTTTTESTTTTTVAPMLDSDRLRTAMPGAADVPADWSVYTEASTGHDPDATSGTCGGSNSTGLALKNGSIAQINGPTFDLPTHGYFGIEAFSFKTPDAASTFLAMYAEQANSCTTTAATFTATEADMHVFAEGFGADAVWHLSETAAAAPETGAGADEALAIADRTAADTTVDATAYGYVHADDVRVERYGRFVIEYWLSGEFGEFGFTNADPGYQPTHDDTLAAAATIRPFVTAALTR